MALSVINWTDVEFGEKIEAIALATNGASREVRIIMPAGEVMKQHRAPYDIFVQVLRGRIWFEVAGENGAGAAGAAGAANSGAGAAAQNDRVELGGGEMVSVAANVPHSLGAVENSVVRLSLAIGDKIERVAGVLKL